MKKLFLFLSLFLGAHCAWAHDAEVDGIFYNLFKGSQCAMVTFQGEEYNSVQNEYKGDVVVPATFTFDGVVYSVTGVEGHSFRDCTELTSVTLPNSVKSIGAECFRYCSSLTTVKLSNSLLSLEEYCFSDCPSLASIDIPNSVVDIERNCFSGCKALTSIALPDSVKTLEWSTFGGCTSLTSVALPDSLKMIASSCFNGCESLPSIVLPDSLETIEWSVFENCKKLKSISIPSSVKSIGSGCFQWCEAIDSMAVEKGNAFYDSREGCNAIIETATNTLIAGCMKTKIPDTVVTLADNCFKGCANLISITIPASVSYLGGSCFNDCVNLSDFHIRRMTPPEASSAWQGIFGWYCNSLEIIYVPKGTKELYEAVYPWAGYKIVEEDVESGITPVVTEGKTAPVYHLGGSRVGTTENFEALPKGIYIVGSKKVLR